MSRNAVNVMLVLFLAVLFGLAGCGGGGSSGNGSAGTQPQITAKDAVIISAPYDLAVVGESYQEQLSAYSSDSTLTIVGYKIAVSSTMAKVSGLLQKVVNAATGTTLPSIDANGTLTWTPTDADMGVRSFDVTAIANNGTEKTITISIEVAKRTSLIQKTVGNEGGVFTDANGEYTLVIPRDAVETGQTAITADISLVRRANGLEQVYENVLNVNTDIGYRLSRPLRPATAAMNPDTSAIAKQVGKSVAATATNTLGNIDAFRGYYVDQSSKLSVIKNSVSVFIANDNGNDNIAVLDGSCTEFTEGGCKDKQGIIFVHGFTPDLFGYGGGTGTWGETFNYVLTELSKTYKVAVYEFKWKTNSRFEEQAFYLSRAIKTVAGLTGVKPIVVAHSFGGTLAATYITGNAEQIGRNMICDSSGCIPKVTQVKYDNDIAELITIGSPLSGINDLPMSSSDSHFKLPIGRDVDDSMISTCSQMTCAEAGFGGYQDFGRRYGYLAEFANDMTKKSSDLYKTMGIKPQYPGYLISKIHSGWKNPPRMRVLIGLKSDSKYLKHGESSAGDGLISLYGQLVLPDHLSNTLGVPSGEYSPKNSTMPNLTYYFMQTTVNNHFIGFAHTKAGQIWGDEKYWNLPEVELPRSDGKIVIPAGTFEHPLATNLKKALAAEKIPYTVDTKQYAKQLKAVVIKKRKTYKTLAKSLYALSASSTGAPFPYVFTVTRISTGEQITRKDGYTDDTGNLNVNVNAVTRLADTVSTDDLKILLVIGDPTIYFPKEIVIDNWTDLLTDLGTIELESRDSLPTKVNISGSVLDNTASSTTISGATIKLKIGDNLAQQAFANTADSTTTRVITTDANGSFTSIGLLPGRYTALISKSGYTTKRQTFDIPETGLSGQNFVLQPSTSTLSCTSPQVLTNGVCVTPTPTCSAPQVLTNGVCVTPTSTAAALTTNLSKYQIYDVFVDGTNLYLLASTPSSSGIVYTDPEGTKYAQKNICYLVINSFGEIVKEERRFPFGEAIGTGTLTVDADNVNIFYNYKPRNDTFVMGARSLFFNKTVSGSGSSNLSEANWGWYPRILSVVAGVAEIEHFNFNGYYRTQSFRGYGHSPEDNILGVVQPSVMSTEYDAYRLAHSRNIIPAQPANTDVAVIKNIVNYLKLN